MNAKLLSLLFLWLFFLGNSTIDYKNILSVKGIKEPFIRVFDFFKSKISDAWYNHKAATIFTFAGVASASLGAVGYLQWRKKKSEDVIVLHNGHVNYLEDFNLIQNIYNAESLAYRDLKKNLKIVNYYFQPIKFTKDNKRLTKESYKDRFLKLITKFKIKNQHPKEYKDFLAIILYMVGVSELLMMLEIINYEHIRKFTFSNKNNNEGIEDLLIKKNEAANCFELFFHMIELLQNKITEIVNLYDDKEIANEQLRTLIKLLKNNYIVNDGYTFNNLEIIFNTPRISFIEKIKENVHNLKYKELWEYLKSDIYRENIGEKRYLTQIEEKLKDSTIDEFELVKKIVNGIKQNNVNNR